MKDVLVCGGTNFMGKRLIPMLLDKDFHVSMVTRGNNPNPFPEAVDHFIINTMDDPEGLKNAFKNKYFDIIIDNVAYHPQEVINVLSAIETGRYIQVSSMAVYYDYHKNIIEDEFDPKNFKEWEKMMRGPMPYYEAKRASESAAYQLFAETNPVIVRPGYVMDIENLDHPKNERIPWFVNHVCNSIPIKPGYDDYDCTFTLTHEEAEVICRLAESNYNKPLNIASQGSVKIGEILSYIEEKSGKKAIYSENGEKPGFTGRDFNPIGFCGESLDVSRLSEIHYEPSALDEWIWRILDIYIEKYLE